MSDSEFGHSALKARQRAERHGFGPNLALRVHRALSWLDRSERTGGDIDARFIFLWIAFNAAYATDIDAQIRQSEQNTFSDFIRKLCELDTHKRLEDLAWNAFPSAIRLLLDNPYVFQPFWDHQAGRAEASDWQLRFEASKTAAVRALGRRDTPTVLSVTLARLYTLRNQLVHGGATWNSSVNRTQLRDCTNLLGQLVPVIICIMMDNPHTLWGDPVYPVVET